MKQNHKFNIRFASFNLNYILKMNFVAWCFVDLENLICFESAHVACWAISKQIRFSSISKYHALKFIFFEQNSSKIMKLLNCPTSPNQLKPQILFDKKSQAQKFIRWTQISVRQTSSALSSWYLPCASTSFVKWRFEPLPKPVKAVLLTSGALVHSTMVALLA